MMSQVRNTLYSTVRYDVTGSQHSVYYGILLCHRFATLCIVRYVMMSQIVNTLYNTVRYDVTGCQHFVYYGTL
jgi:hypothetical protein